jgi:D-3-phosphoglycerate dehydrogenase / 2-oxoglutarate reductase
VTKPFPREKIKVVLLEGVHARGRELLADEGFQVEAHAKALEGEALLKAVAGAHVLGIRSKTQLREPALAKASRLLTIGAFCIGTDQVDLRGAAARGVPVFNSPFSNTRSVAELTVAEVVALLRGAFEKSRKLHEGEWDKSAAGSHEARGKTLGIVGYGHIGSQVSVLAEGLGMRVIYYDIVPKLPIGNARPVRSLAELLKASDVVTLHVPDTVRTRAMIGTRELAAMRKGAALINNARGSIVEIPALAAAITSGHLAGAAADVFPVEPSGKGERFECELRGLPNVILTPHIGGSTEEAQEAIAEDVAAKLAKFVNNGSTTGAVNVPEVELAEQGARPEDGTTAAQSSEDRGTRHHRILHFHRNVPGVLSKMHAAIAELGVNINAEHLQTRGEVGYVVLDVDPTEGERVLERLRAVPDTIRVRMLW